MDRNRETVRERGDEYQLYAAQSSYYSAKPRACLQYKRLPYVALQINLARMGSFVLPKTGTHYIPVLLCPDGTVVQDSITIVETLEARHPERPVIPEDPVLALVAEIFDTLTDGRARGESAARSRAGFPVAVVDLPRKKSVQQARRAGTRGRGFQRRTQGIGGRGLHRVLLSRAPVVHEDG
jgi:glutathione S-transferase